MSNDVIEVDTPLGYTVVCSRAQWYNHIIPGHSFMKGNIKAVEDALRTPDCVYKSGGHPERHIYFGKSTSATYGDRFYTKVVVAPEDGRHTEMIVGDAKREVVSAWNQPKISGNIGEMLYDKTQSGQEK